MQRGETVRGGGGGKSQARSAEQPRNCDPSPNMVLDPTVLLATYYTTISTILSLLLTTDSPLELVRLKVEPLQLGELAEGIG